MKDCHFRTLYHSYPRYLPLYLLFIILALSGNPFAADIKTFTTWLNEGWTASDHYDKQTTEKYHTFSEQEERTLNEFVLLAERKWGKNNVSIPEAKVWVQYEDDLEVRSSVDFENGVGSVQILLEKEQKADSDTVNRQLAEAVEDLFLGRDERPVEMMRRLMSPEKGKDKEKPVPTVTRPKPEISMKYYTVQQGDTLWGLSKRFKVSRIEIAQNNNIGPDDWLITGQRLLIPGQRIESTPAKSKKIVKPSAKRPRAPLLHGLLNNSDGTPVTHKNVAGYANEIVRSQAHRTASVHGTDGINRQAVSISFRLIPDHLRIRAERYRQFVRRYSEKFGIYAPLIYAVIHTESAFNPMARSGAPAYGLMQLVPGSGARDAYLMVYGVDKYLDPEYLYDPGNNIELGTAYLHILDGRYLKRIENPTSRMYCSIAAYNTGAGNVSRAFTDSTSIRQAATTINQMSPDQVYARLRSDLPYEETKNYIKRVCDRIPLYEERDGG